MDPSAPCPVELDLSLAALRMECGALDVVIDRLRRADEPTRLPGWSVQHLIAHLVRQIDKVRTYLAAPIPPEPEVSWLDYWTRARGAADPGSIAKHAREFAAQINDRPIREVWRSTWQRSVEEAGTCEPGRLLRPPFGAMRLDHYLTTRVLEVTVHGLDLRAALGLEEVATPFALEVTTRLLDGLLDGERPEALDGVPYVLAATGRVDHDDPRLPVLS